MENVRRGMVHGIPIALGYVSVSFTFGILGVSGGLDWWQTVLISMFNLTSAGQFAGLDIMLAGGTMVEMALSQLVINLRYALMSLSLSQKLDRSVATGYRALLGTGITDEIFAVAMSQSGRITRGYFFGLIAVPYLGWAGGTAAGALLGEVIPQMVRESLGIAIYAMFLAIILPKARRERKYFLVILVAALMSCGFAVLPILRDVSSGFVVIICAVTASALGAWRYPVEEAENRKEGEHADR